MVMPKIVTYISNNREEFTATIVADTGKGYLNLEIKRPGGKTQRIFNVPKKDSRDKHSKFYWFEKFQPQSKTTPETGST